MTRSQRFSAPYGNSCRSRGGWRPVRSRGTAGRRCRAVATRLSCLECSPGEDEQTRLWFFVVLLTLEHAQASSYAGHCTSTAACCFHTSAGDLKQGEKQKGSTVAIWILCLLVIKAAIFNLLSDGCFHYGLQMFKPDWFWQIFKKQHI